MNNPALAHLVGAYFHEDWTDYGTVDKAVEDFATGEPAFVGDVPSEIDAVLTAYPDESSLEAYLDSMGSAYYALPEEGGYRGWLLQLKQLVEAELTRPAVGRSPG